MYSCFKCLQALNEQVQISWFCLIKEKKAYCDFGCYTRKIATNVLIVSVQVKAAVFQQHFSCTLCWKGYLLPTLVYKPVLYRLRPQYCLQWPCCKASKKFAVILNPEKQSLRMFWTKRWCSSLLICMNQGSFVLSIRNKRNAFILGFTCVALSQAGRRNG